MIDSVFPAWDAAVIPTLAQAVDARAGFESALAPIVGFGLPIVVPSARWGIQAALTALGIGPGAEVIVPAFLCRAVAEAVLGAGAVPVLCDVGLPDGTPRGADVDAVLTSRTRAVILPHLFGMPQDYTEVAGRVRPHGIHVIEDCAHTLGARIAGVGVGAGSTCAVFSFSYDKPIALGGGGAVVPGALAPEGFEGLLRESVQRCDRAPSVARERAELAAMARWFRARRLIGDGTAFRVAGLLLRGAPAGRRFLARTRNPGRAVPGDVRCELGRHLADDYASTLARRNANAERLRAAAMAGGLATVEPAPAMLPAYLRLNVLASGEDRAGQLAAELRRKSFRAGPLNWPVTLDEVAGLAGRVRVRQGVANAHAMARRSVNVPVHQALSAADLAVAESVLREAVG